MSDCVIQFLPGLFDGGAETLVRNYCFYSKKNNKNMKIVSFIKLNNTANERFVKENNIDVIRIYKRWTFLTRIFHKVFGKLYVPYKLKKIILHEHVKAIHCHMKVLKYLSPLSSFLKKRNINLFYTCHSLPKRYLGVNSEEFIACKKLLRKNKLQIIALHEDMRIEINRLFSINTAIVIRNGIDFEKFKYCPNTRLIKRNELNISADQYVIGHIGRFEKIKNHGFILDVFEKALEKNSNCHLLLIGTGPLEQVVLERINKNGYGQKVTMLKNRLDVSDLLSAMDVFLFPSLFEGISVTLIEAQAANLDCVVSNTINLETIFSSKVRMLSLDDDVDVWVNNVLFTGCKNNMFKDKEDYDIRSILSKLYTLYYR